MAIPTYAEMQDTYILSQAEVEGALALSGIRGDVLLNRLAPYATTANDIPVAQGDYADTYTLDTAAKLEDVLAYIGPRGPKVFEYLLSVKGA